MGLQFQFSFANQPNNFNLFCLQVDFALCSPLAANQIATQCGNLVSNLSQVTLAGVNPCPLLCCFSFLSYFYFHFRIYRQSLCLYILILCLFRRLLVQENNLLLKLPNYADDALCTLVTTV